MFDRMNRLFFFGLVNLAVFNCIVCEVKKNSNADKNACPEESDEAWSFDQCEKHSDKGVKNTQTCMKEMSSILKNGNCGDVVKAIETLEQILTETYINESTTLTADGLVAFVYKLKGPFEGLQIPEDKNKVISEVFGPNKNVSIQLPKELDVKSNSTIVFCMLTWSNQNWVTRENGLYEDIMIGLSVRGKNISNLQEHISYTINLSSGINETQTLSCVFLNYSAMTFSKDGCTTSWEPGQSSVTCSCDHLTYFGVLVVPNTPSPAAQEILTYITMIGCSLSLFALVLTIVLFILNRKAKDDVSVKIHLNLSVALILLNVFFLSSRPAAASSAGLCVYVALSLHYSLLAAFFWMGLEGFHLYLLLVKVFNIYVRRYLLKLCLVGWGVPAVIVSLVVIIDRNSYGLVPLDSINPESTSICYISKNTVKIVTTVGIFSVVFAFNITMLGVTVRRFMSLHKSKEFGQRNCNRAKQDICSLLGIITLLGVTWGLVFFSFGHLTNAALYPFCILNSLQGFFIFLWFVMSMKKSGNSTPKMSSVTRSTNS
ncbi:adhesion G-protein coupled receptor G2 [Nelusetta ayraudi]|uniref:adhesion G-protein coupled receptor G2 n=1 Tax=Nelusetta ayraudi TaxID=303726 RepID=UPI003F7059E4